MGRGAGGAGHELGRRAGGRAKGGKEGLQHCKLSGRNGLQVPILVQG